MGWGKWIKTESRQPCWLVCCDGWYVMSHDLITMKTLTSILIPYLYKESLDESKSHESLKSLYKI
jgi:hypothetical protein